MAPDFGPTRGNVLDGEAGRGSVAGVSASRVGCDRRAWGFLDGRFYRELPKSRYRRSGLVLDLDHATIAVPQLKVDLWKIGARVHQDHHIEVGRAYYSVHYTLVGQRVDARLAARDPVSVDPAHPSRAPPVRKLLI